MEINYKSIGKRIKQERINQNLTQEKLAEMVSISLTHMSNIENANTKLSLDVLLKIANASNCNTDVLLCGNITNNLNATDSIISEMLRDCTNTERTIIIDTVQSLKNTLIANREEGG